MQAAPWAPVYPRHLADTFVDIFVDILADSFVDSIVDSWVDTLPTPLFDSFVNTQEQSLLFWNVPLSGLSRPVKAITECSSVTLRPVTGCPPRQPVLCILFLLFPFPFLFSPFPFSLSLLPAPSPPCAFLSFFHQKSPRNPGDFFCFLFSVRVTWSLAVFSTPYQRTSA